MLYATQQQRVSLETVGSILMKLYMGMLTFDPCGNPMYFTLYFRLLTRFVTCLHQTRYENNSRDLEKTMLAIYGDL